MKRFSVPIAAVAAAILVALIAPTIGRCAPPTLSDGMNNLQGRWLFKTDPGAVGEAEGRQKLGYDDSNWGVVNVPGDWESQGGGTWSSYDGVAWYRFRFVVPKSWAGEDLTLFFGSIDDEDRTFVNGKLVGALGPGKKVPSTLARRYRVPASILRPGKENVLAVRVYDGGGPGGIPGSPVLLVPTKRLTSPVKLPQANRPLAARFANPPAESRILKIIHGWPNAAADQDLLTRSLADQGFGGVVCNVSFQDYLTSEARWTDFVRAVTQAKKAGMSLWLYDEKGYPSGTAGGLTLKGHPDWEVEGLMSSEATTTGGPVSLDVPPGDLVLAKAFPEENGQIVAAKAVDLTSSVSDRRLTWNAPAGAWRVLAVTRDRLYDNTFNAVSFGDKLPYVNLLRSESTDRFIELTHGAYAKHLGNDLGKWFVSTFTDEPSLMNRFVQGSKYRGLPWSPNLPSEFFRRRGYDLEPVIPLLLTHSGPQGEKARYDFWLTIGELVSENYFGRIQEFCHEHGFASGGHLLQEEPLLDHVALYGDFFACVRRLDAPSIDCLTSAPSEVPWQIARLVSSVAELEGKTTTMSETSDFSQIYRSAGDTRPVRVVSEGEIRGTCNREILGGITTITSYYSFRERDRASLRRLNEWVGRCSTMLSGGHRVADVAVVYPTESLWPKFIPAKVGPTDEPSAERISLAYDTAANTLYEAARDFSFVDSRAIRESKAGQGTLAHGDLNWRALILPAVDTLPTEAWERIAEFWRGGGVVIAMGSLPTNSELEFPSPSVQSIARELFGTSGEGQVSTNAAGGVGVFLPSGMESILPSILDSVLAPDVKPSDPRSPIRATHRRVGGHEVYFIINDSDAAWSGSVSLSSTGSRELWDPATGKVSPLPGQGPVSLKLGPYGAAIVRFASAVTPKRLAPKTGAIPGPVFHAIECGEPRLGSGEFVKAEVNAVPGEPGFWRAQATVTKSNVDTFSMVAFPCSGIEGAEYLRVDCRIPDGQSTPTKLLLILQDESGVQFLGETGISLAAPGRHRVIIPVARIQPVPWSTTPGARLDLSKIRTIVLGWGGYFGTEGERVEFTVACPQVGVSGE